MKSETVKSLLLSPKEKGLPEEEQRETITKSNYLYKKNKERFNMSVHKYTTGARTRNVVSCNFVQGNISAYKSHAPALEFLKDNGIDARYNDGWMMG